MEARPESSLAPGGRKESRPSISETTMPSILPKAQRRLGGRGGRGF